MNLPAAAPPTDRRLAIAVYGVVQGVGFRPFVHNAARAAGLAGWVRNEADTVRIEVQGSRAALDAFLDTLRRRHPPQARLDSIEVHETTCRRDRSATFQILASRGAAAPRPAIPTDLATCAACLEEIRDPRQRRCGYPLTNCTNCGPRWSIIQRLPYDRPQTSMADFAMCGECRAEYEDPADRRFHAQPIACPKCGPALRLLDRQGRETAAGGDALSTAVEAVLAGRIVAMKGLGGFQLLVDATNADAVELLRRRKRRPDKPFAIMLHRLDDVRRHCEVRDEEARVLLSHAAPIVLLRRRGFLGGDFVGDSPSPQPSPRGRGSDVVRGVAPGNPYLGVMLPYTPLHHLLMDAIDRPIVCTSGNLSEEPMAITTGDALKRLGHVADVILTHNRPIVRPVDDSLVRLGCDGMQVLRRARGFAPLPIVLGEEGSGFRVQGTGRNPQFPAPSPQPLVPRPSSPAPRPQIVAVGGHLKNTVALALGREVVMSPHVGDLEHVLSAEAHRRAVRDLVDFFEAEPDVVACDLHPDYASTRHAEVLAAEWGVPLVRVQHHHAHVAACMAEHQLEGPVLGFSWDGAGYGGDGVVWGGEALLCKGAEFSRLGHLRTFPLPGGDTAAREPRRSALGLLFEMMGDEAADCAAEWFRPAELKTLLSMLAREVRAPHTSSMGRLFDGVAALCGLPAVISFEGQAAMALEFAADANETGTYPLPISGEDSNSGIVADWEPLIRAVLADVRSAEPVGRIAARFHNALAEMAAATARSAGCKQVALSGGCFQNALLSERLRARLSQEGFAVYTHKKVPPNDGGIALGQVFVAARRVGG